MTTRTNGAQATQALFDRQSPEIQKRYLALQKKEKFDAEDAMYYDAADQAGQYKALAHPFYAEVVTEYDRMDTLGEDSEEKAIDLMIDPMDDGAHCVVFKWDADKGVWLMGDVKRNGKSLSVEWNVEY